MENWDGKAPKLANQSDSNPLRLQRQRSPGNEIGTLRFWCKIPIYWVSAKMHFLTQDVCNFIAVFEAKCNLSTLREAFETWNRVTMEPLKRSVDSNFTPVRKTTNFKITNFRETTQNLFALQNIMQNSMTTTFQGFWHFLYFLGLFLSTFAFIILSNNVGKYFYKSFCLYHAMV